MGEAWFSVLALEYYLHLSEWTWTEATWRNYWIRGLRMCCGRQDQTSIPDWWWSSAPPSSALPFLLRSPILGHFCYYQKAGNWKSLPWSVLLLPEGTSFCACLWRPILVWLDIGTSMGSIDSMHNKRHHFFLRWHPSFSPVAGEWKLVSIQSGLTPLTLSCLKTQR